MDSNQTEKIKLSRTKNTVRNIFAGVLNKFVTLLLPFFVRTVFIWTIGIEYAGLNSLFTSILQVLNLSELGFSSAVIYSMYKPIAENDHDTICALLSFYKKIYFVIGIVIFVLGSALSPFLKYLIHGEIPSDINIYILYFIFISNTVIGYLLFGYRQSLFNAFQRQDVLSNILTITTGFQNILQIVILLFIKNYYVYVVLFPISTILNNLIVKFLSERYYPDFRPVGSISTELKNDIKIKIKGLFVSKICGVTRNSFDSIFISMFLGLSITAIYTNYYMIMSALTGFLVILVNSMTAGIGNAVQTETKEKNYFQMEKINFVYMWISGFCTICLLCLYQPFIKIWLGTEYLLKTSTVLLLCIYFYILKIGDVRSIYVDATGTWYEARWRALAESLANIILNALLGKIFGINGIVLATAISLFIFNFIAGSQILFHCYWGKSVQTTRKIKKYYFSNILYAITTLCSAFICFYISNKIQILLNCSLILKMILILFECILISNILYLIVYSRTTVFKSSRDSFTNLIKKIIRN